MGRGGHGGHGGFHGGHGGHGGLVGFVAGAVIRGAVAGAVIASTRRRPAYVHHRYSSRVVVVSGAGTRSRVIEVVCPAGLAPGQVIELAVDGETVYATVPDGVAPGQAFQVRVELAGAPAAPPPVAVVAPPPAPPPATVAAIVSDNHGTWTREKFAGGVAHAERAWRRLGSHYASVLFAQNVATGAWRVEKSWGFGGAVAAIEKRFHEEFVHELFPPVATAQPLPTAPPAAVAAEAVPLAPPEPPMETSSANPF